MKKRNLNADLIRCVAVYSVVSVHFLLNSGFYGVPVQGADMLVMCMVRSLFMTCVPLFLLLTGYLMGHKTLSRGYYKGLVKTLEIYLLACAACLLFKKLYLGESVTPKTAILDILDFDAANYAWYIEMYIGLYVMIPFLNLAYGGLRTRREKCVLVWTMIALTMLPKLLNHFDLRTAGWWSSPSVSTTYDPVVPGFFTAMYPVTYYFIGSYLREYGWRLGTRMTALLFVIAAALFGCGNFWRSDGGNFVWASNSTWGGENLITAVLLFGLLLRVNAERLPRFLQRLLVGISKISLGLYLVSWIFDKLVYRILKENVPTVNDRWGCYFLAVPVVFLCSALLSCALYLIRNGVHAAAHRLRIDK